MHRYAIEVEGKRYEVEVDDHGGDRYEVHLEGRVLAVRLEEPAADPHAPVAHAPTEHHEAFTVPAPLPGVIATIGVAPGQRISRGDVLLTLEAMKMINPIHAPRDGVVRDVQVAVGQTVAHGDPLLTLVG